LDRLVYQFKKVLCYPEAKLTISALRGVFTCVHL